MLAVVHRIPGPLVNGGVVYLSRKRHAVFVVGACIIRESLLEEFGRHELAEVVARNV